MAKDMHLFIVFIKRCTMFESALIYFNKKAINLKCTKENLSVMQRCALSLLLSRNDLFNKFPYYPRVEWALFLFS